MDDNYFDDCYQGIPKNGYTELFEKLLDGIEIRLNTDYFSDRNNFDSMAKKVVYTGPIDEFFNYKYGQLEWRSLRFEHLRLDIEDFQLILNGRVIKSAEDIISLHTKTNTKPTFYLNAAKVHGGCNPYCV